MSESRGVWADKRTVARPPDAVIYRPHERPLWRNGAIRLNGKDGREAEQAKLAEGGTAGSESATATEKQNAFVHAGLPAAAVDAFVVTRKSSDPIRLPGKLQSLNALMTVRAPSTPIGGTRVVNPDRPP